MKEIIAIESLKKVYRMGSQELMALDGIDLKIGANEFVAIMGPSGSGKSTLMNILGCLDTPTSGRYVLGGEDVSAMDSGQLARVRSRRTGFVFQSFNLLPRYNALENVALPLIYQGVPKAERLARARAALEAVGLEGRMEHRPAEMSGGQRQRVAVARALVGRPDIILADEPTGNLDTQTSVGIMKLFEEIYRQGNTIVLVTHEEDIAGCARRIIRLRDGKIESDTINAEPALAHMTL